MAESSQRLTDIFFHGRGEGLQKEGKRRCSTGCNAAEDSNISVEGDTEEKHIRLRTADTNTAKPLEICICGWKWCGTMLGQTWKLVRRKIQCNTQKMLFLIVASRVGWR